MSSNPRMVKPTHFGRAIFYSLLLPWFLAASASISYGQFTLTTTALYPAAVTAGESATATINLGPQTGFDQPVALSCTVTSGPTTDTPPVCTPSPTSEVPPAKPALTITTATATAAGTYQFTLTGTSGSSTQTATLYLGVSPTTQNYALTVLQATATPGSIPPGETATSTVTISPLGTYGGHMVTLSCLSITPIVTGAPTCSFVASTGAASLPANTVQVNAGTPATAVLTITSYGPAATTTTKLWNRRIFLYALGLAIPGLALVGVGASKGRRKNALGVLLLIAIAGGVLLMPACGATNLTSNTTTAVNGKETPKNNYTFTLTGVDETGASPSATIPTTVTLDVN